MKINPHINSLIQLTTGFTGDVGLDLETSGLVPREQHVLVLALTLNKETYVLATNKYAHADLVTLIDSLSSARKVIAHNAKFDAGFIYYHYNVVMYNLYCSMLGSQILNNGKNMGRGHSLKDCLKSYLDVDLDAINTSSKKVLQKSFIGMRPDAEISYDQLLYAGNDTMYLEPLAAEQERLAKRAGLTKIFTLENRLIPIVVKMEVGGCLIDKKGWQLLIRKWGLKLDELTLALDDEIRRLATKFPALNVNLYTRKRVTQTVYLPDIFGNIEEVSNTNTGNVNYGSTMQIMSIFRLLGETIPIGKTGSESLDENALTTFKNENTKSPLLPFISVLIEFREYEKLLSTYGDSFLCRLDKNNYIHTSYTQCRTKTGRLSSQNPNLQNIPSRGEGGDIRKLFVARPGFKLLTSDMNSAEVAIAADYSKDPLLLGAIINGEDMHSKLASISFSIIFNQQVTVTNSEDPIEINGRAYIPNKLRKAHKTVLFAKFYKAGANRIYQSLAEYINLIYSNKKERLTIAKRISQALDKEMPKLTNYLSTIISRANKQGFLVGSKLGRIRWFPEEAYGDAANMPIQCTNAEAMKIALINIDKYLVPFNDGSRLVMNIHDEVVCELPNAHAEKHAEKIKDIMGESLSFFMTTVKGGASIKLLDYWEK